MFTHTIPSYQILRAVLYETKQSYRISSVKFAFHNDFSCQAMNIRSKSLKTFIHTHFTLLTWSTVPHFVDRGRPALEELAMEFVDLKSDWTTKYSRIRKGWCCEISTVCKSFLKEQFLIKVGYKVQPYPIGWRRERGTLNQFYDCNLNYVSTCLKKADYEVQLHPSGWRRERSTVNKFLWQCF